MKYKSHVVQCNDATRTQQFQAHFIVTVVVHFVGIDKYKIKCAGLACIQQLLCKEIASTIRETVF